MPTEAGESFVDKLRGLIRSKPSHQDFPTSERYEGTVESTSRAYELEGAPLETHVQVVSPGYYDVLPRVEEPTAPREEGPGFVDRLTTLFQKKHPEYPVSVPYEGPYSETGLYRDVEGVPLQEHVSFYHATGRSDMEPTPTKVEVVEEGPTEPGLLGKLAGVFKKHHEEHPDYPLLTEPYIGPIDSTHRAYEVEGQPLETYVSAYHSGRSDEAPVKVEVE